MRDDLMGVWWTESEASAFLGPEEREDTARLGLRIGYSS